MKWGRIGTTIGQSALQKFGSLQDAVDFFEHKFEEKSGNEWKKRNEFEKKARARLSRFSAAVGS